MIRSRFGVESRSNRPARYLRPSNDVGTFRGAAVAVSRSWVRSNTGSPTRCPSDESADEREVRALEFGSRFLPTAQFVGYETIELERHLPWWRGENVDERDVDPVEAREGFGGDRLLGGLL